jgi:hypothetical protein
MTKIVLAQDDNQQYGGLCEKCNRQFAISSNQLQSANTAEILINPSDWGLRNGMTQEEVKSVLGEPVSVKNAAPFTWWLYPDNKRVEFAQFSKDTKSRLYFCSVLGSNIVTTGQPNTIKCPYCGITQDAQMASNRYTYELKRQQEHANQEQTSANRQAVSGLVQTIGNSVNSMYERRIQANQACMQQNTDNYMAYLRQQAQSPRPTCYQPMPSPSIQAIPRPSTLYNVPKSSVLSEMSSTTSGTITRVGPGQYEYKETSNR